MIPIFFLFLSALLYLRASRRALALPALAFALGVLMLWAAHTWGLWGAARGLPDWHLMHTVEAGRYYSVVLPALAAWGCGLWWSARRAVAPDWSALEAYLARHSWQGYALVVAGLAASALLPYLPAGWRLLGLYGQQLIPVAGFYFVFTPGARAKLALALVGFWLTAQALETAFWGDWALWIFVLVNLYFIRYDTALWRRGLVFTGAALAFLFLLTFKYAYRERAATAPTLGGKATAFFESAAGAVRQPDSLLRQPGLRRAVQRLDQGHLTGKAIAYVPAQAPYARGETLLTALKATLIPRLLWPGKPEAGGRHLYDRFTGETLTPGVSANIGQVGEAYVNFGPWGAWTYMLLYGLLFGGLYAAVSRRDRTYPPVALWLPFLFAPLLTLETDTLTVLNHLVKAGAFAGGVAGILWGTGRKAELN